MFVECIKARVGVAVGDVVEIPDGSEVSELFYRLCDPPKPKPAEPVFPPAA